jgi:DNA-binding transcriptional MerR regulator
MRTDSYTVGEAQAITGIGPDRWRYWHKRGLLAPSVDGPKVQAPRPGARGRRPGSPSRRYGREDVLVGVLVRELLSLGLSLQRVRRAVVVLRQRFGPAPLHEALRGSSFRLVVTRGLVLVVEGDAAWELGGQGVLPPVDLARAARTAQELIAGWRRRKKIEDAATAREHEASVRRALKERRGVTVA